MTEYRLHRRVLNAITITLVTLLTIWSVLVLTWLPAEDFLREHYLAIAWGGLIPGMIASAIFLMSHRPTYWFSRASLNSSGWVVVIFLLYLRSAIAITLQRDSIVWQGAGNALNSIGFLVIIDYLLVYRVFSFLQYRLTYRKALQEMDRRDAEDLSTEG